MKSIEIALKPYEQRFSNWLFLACAPDEGGPCFSSDNGKSIVYQYVGDELQLVFVIGESTQFRLMGPRWPASSEETLARSVAESWAFLEEHGFDSLLQYPHPHEPLWAETLRDQEAIYKAVDRYDKHFKSRGFVKRRFGHRGPRFEAADGRGIEFEYSEANFMGLDLTVGDPPHYVVCAKNWHATCADELEKAVAKSWDFLDESGFGLLEEALRVPEDEWHATGDSVVFWRTSCRIVVTWPETMSVNDLVMNAKDSIPKFRQCSALEVRSLLDSSNEIVIQDVDLLKAVDMARELHQLGFTTKLLRP